VDPAVSVQVATIDFHVTSECSQSCPYCWGPQDFETPVDTTTAMRIIERVRRVGATRIVFTGGDPLTRPDVGLLIRHACQCGLETALSTTGDELTRGFLAEYGAYLDLISLPLDGPTEEVNARTKEKGHFAAVMRALDRLRAHPGIDVKVCTPVTRQNLNEVPAIVRLVEEYAGTTDARVFYNIFQAFPRAMSPVDWDALLVSDEEFAHLMRTLPPQRRIRVNLLDHATLDRLYVMIFPDGSLVVPNGPDYQAFGPFLEIEDLGAALETSQFDAPKHRRHSLGWTRTVRA
jgi:MoaA/NifB/PqqE/SkfB family radical SAM enzyme